MPAGRRHPGGAGTERPAGGLIARDAWSCPHAGFGVRTLFPVLGWRLRVLGEAYCLLADALCHPSRTPSEFYGADISQGGVATDPIIITFDVTEYFGANEFRVPEFMAVNPFDFQ